MKIIVLFFSFVLLCLSLFSQEEVRLKNGKTITINPDGTWKYKQANTSINTFTDSRDGYVYKIVTIGTQVWMAENLRTNKYRNGDPIFHAEFEKLTTGAYYNYMNDPNKATTFGKLYNWYAVNDSRNIAPVGWHVPTDAEWTILTTYLGGESIAGGKLKETSTKYWAVPNTSATNESGFTALPGSWFADGGFVNCCQDGKWWSSTESSERKVWSRSVFNDASYISRANHIGKDCGLSVRCIKDR